MNLNDSKGKTEFEVKILGYMWNGLYWAGFILCWGLLPIITSYEDSCEFTVLGKLKYSIKLNAIYYIIEVAALGICAIIYIIIKGVPGSKEAMALVMALTNAWGLIQIVLFLSNGMIGTIKFFLKKIILVSRFKLICCKLIQIQEIMDDDSAIIEKSLRKLQSIEAHCSKDNADYINKIYETVPEELTSFRTISLWSVYDEEITGTNDEVRSIIADNHYKIKSNMMEYIAQKDKLERTIETGIFLKQLIISVKKNSKYIIEHGKPEPEKTTDKIKARLRFLWHTLFMPILFLIICALLVLYAVLVVLGECGLAFPGHHYYFYPIGYLLRENHNFWEVLLITVPTLGMLLTYICYGILHFKLSKFYGLFPHQQADPSCLVYSSMFTAKLTFPICYNYLLILSLNVEGETNRTVFENLMGVLDLVPVMGCYFQKYFPCVIAILLIINIFEIYDRVMKSLSLDNFTFVVDLSDSNFKLGADLLNKEIAKRKKKIAESNDKKTTLNKSPKEKNDILDIDPVLIEQINRSKQKENSGKKKNNTEKSDKSLLKTMEDTKNFDELLIDTVNQSELDD